MLSKQWIKTTNIKDEPTVYNEPLLPFVLDVIQDRGRIDKASFTQFMDQVLCAKYSPIMLSNLDSMRYVRGLLLASDLVIADGNDFIINPLATALVHDFISNSDKLTPPSEETEFESYWNTMEHGVYDIISQENKSIYSSFYPNLIK